MREVIMNQKTNLLQLEEHFYQLVDVEEPNVFHNLFPYDEIPKIAFNDRIVPHNMPENIWITDTTFRDGQQSRAPYTTEQIVTIYDYLHKLGGPKGLIRQSEFFLYSKKDRDAVYKCLERGYKFPDPCGRIGVLRLRRSSARSAREIRRGRRIEYARRKCAIKKLLRIFICKFKIFVLK